MRQRRRLAVAACCFFEQQRALAPPIRARASQAAAAAAHDLRARARRTPATLSRAPPQFAPSDPHLAPPAPWHLYPSPLHLCFCCPCSHLFVAQLPCHNLGQSLLPQSSLLLPHRQHLLPLHVDRLLLSTASTRPTWSRCLACGCRCCLVSPNCVLPQAPNSCQVQNNRTSVQCAQYICNVIWSADAHAECPCQPLRSHDANALQAKVLVVLVTMVCSRGPGLRHSWSRS